MRSFRRGKMVPRLPQVGDEMIEFAVRCRFIGQAKDGGGRQVENAWPTKGD